MGIKIKGLNIRGPLCDVIVTADSFVEINDAHACHKIAQPVIREIMGDPRITNSEHQALDAAGNVLHTTTNLAALAGMTWQRTITYSNGTPLSGPLPV